MTIRNKVLYSKLLLVTKAVIAFLKKIPKAEFPTRNDCVYTFKENGYETREESRIDYDWLLLNLRDKIGSLPEIQEIGNYMANNSVIRNTFKVSDNNGNQVKHLTAIIVYDFNIRFFLGRYFNKKGSLEFDKQIFDAVCSDLDNYFYKRTFDGVRYAPLENFSCESDIFFTKNLRIRKLTDYEKVEFLELQKMYIWGGFPFESTYAMEIAFHKKRKGPSTEMQDRQVFEDVLTSLRLFKHGFVNFHIISGRSNLWVPCSLKSYGSGRNYKQSFGPNFNMTASEISDVKTIYRKFKKFQIKNRSNPREYLNIAVRRFNLGIEESDIEDRIIDFMISFETMFLADDKELSYKLSNRVAILIGKTADDREELREIIKLAYGWRSKIVHGSEKQPLKIQGHTISENDLALKVEDILRKSILGFVSLDNKNHNRQDIIACLDKSLLSTKILKKLQSDANMV
jgi:hypothetical protein